MKTPTWHFHEKSKSYVFGIKLEDGCATCDVFQSLLDERTKSHLLCVSFSEEFAEKALERYQKNEPIFKVNEENKEIKNNTNFQPIKDLYQPTKDDIGKWKKQFSGIISKLKGTEAVHNLGVELGYVDKSLRFDETEEYESSNQPIVNSSGQSSLFGEVIESKRKKRKK